MVSLPLFASRSLPLAHPLKADIWRCRHRRRRGCGSQHASPVKRELNSPEHRACCTSAPLTPCSSHLEILHMDQSGQVPMAVHDSYFRHTSNYHDRPAPKKVSFRSVQYLFAVTKTSRVPLTSSLQTLHVPWLSWIPQ
jgi:hypothetical protein